MQQIVRTPRATRESQATVLVRQGGSQGTAVFVCRGYLLTAAHVVDGGDSASVIGNGAYRYTYSARVAARDTANDVALLAIDPSLRQPPPIPVATDTPRGSVVNWGYAQGRLQRWDVRVLDSRDVSTTHPPNHAGASGSGMFSDGQLVAIHSGSSGNRGVNAGPGILRRILSPFCGPKKRTKWRPVVVPVDPPAVIKGDKGDPGDDGRDGADGRDGKDADMSRVEALEAEVAELRRIIALLLRPYQFQVRDGDKVLGKTTVTPGQTKAFGVDRKLLGVPGE